MTQSDESVQHATGSGNLILNEWINFPRTRENILTIFCRFVFTKISIQWVENYPSSLCLSSILVKDNERQKHGWCYTIKLYIRARKARHHAESPSYKPVSAKIKLILISSAVKYSVFLEIMRTLLFLCFLFILQTEARRGSSNRRRSRGSRRRPAPDSRQINHEYFNCVANFPCPDEVSVDTCRHEAVRTCSAKY